MKTDNRQTTTQNKDKDETEVKQPQPSATGKTENDKKINWKQVVLGGIPGVLIGASAAFLNDPAAAHSMFDDIPAGGGGEGGEHHLDVVSDDMSFGEAFAAARAELGPGGVFEWRGGLYGTYTADEWAEIHPQDGSEDELNVDTVSSEELANGGQTTGGEDADGIDSEMENGHDESEVVILGVADGELNDGADILVGNVTVDGEEVLLVDMNNDGEFDGIVVDPQGDTIDGDEIENIQDLHLSVDEFTADFESYDSGSLGDEAYWNDGI